MASYKSLPEYRAGYDLSFSLEKGGHRSFFLVAGIKNEFEKSLHIVNKLKLALFLIFVSDNWRFTARFRICFSPEGMCWPPF